MRYFAKATTPRRLCGIKIRTPVHYVSKAIYFCPETIADGSSMKISVRHTDVIIDGFPLYGNFETSHKRHLR